jgi:peptidoglycan/xylan/chitin deacetylase (PgdA/CDA1 family)
VALKPTFKSVVGTFVRNPLLRPVVRRSALRKINIFYYHHVGPSAPHYKAFYSGCTVSKLAEDLRALSYVFDFVTLPELVTAEPPKQRPQRPTIAITFDDGFDLCRDEVMQVLADYRVRATTFIITSCMDNARMMWRHALSAIQALVPESVWRRAFDRLSVAYGFTPIGNQELLAATAQWNMRHKDEWSVLLWQSCGLPPIEEYLDERQPYFTWSGLRQWLSAGHSVGFHTHTHPYCSRLALGDLDAEFVRPALALQRRLNLSRLWLSYPFGERLQPSVERHLVELGLFDAYLGIEGCSPRGTPKEALGRAAAEADDVGWTLLRGILGAGRAGKRKVAACHV